MKTKFIAVLCTIALLSSFWSIPAFGNEVDSGQTGPVEENAPIQTEMDEERAPVLLETLDETGSAHDEVARVGASQQSISARMGISVQAGGTTRTLAPQAGDTTETLSPQAAYTAPEYASGVWTITSGAALHYALANASDGDTFKLMNDLNMGAVCDYPGHDHGEAFADEVDGIAESLYFFGTSFLGKQQYELIPGDESSTINTQDMSGMTLNFVSGTGSAVSIYRRDHLPHIYANANDLTLNFDKVVLDGGQTVYDPDTGERALPFEYTGSGGSTIPTFENSSGGGLYLERTANLTLHGAFIQNCYQPHDYVKNIPDLDEAKWLGVCSDPKNRIMQGAGIRAIYAENIVVKNSTVTHCYSDAYAGGIFMFGYGGTIDNCTVTNNAIFEPLRFGAGGGISYSALSDNAVICDSLISGNSATGTELTPGSPSRGGGVSISGGSTKTFTIEDTVISDNTSQWGGGIFVESCSLVLDTVDVTGNLGAHDVNVVYGGGISMYSSGTLTLKGEVNITDNAASTVANNAMGGGMFINGGKVVTEAGAQVTLEGNTLDGTTKGGAGAGLYISIASSGVDLSGWKLKDNAASSANGSASGGGLYASLKNGSLTATGLEVTGNSARRGGGMYLASVANNNTATLTSCTISGNTAVFPEGAKPLHGCGAGISISSYYSSLFLADTSFADNVAEFGPQRLDAADNLEAIHSANVTGLVSLSTPFIAGTDTAYNNHDVEYVRAPHTIAFDSNGGSSVDEQAVYDGHKAIEPADFDSSRPDYVFFGWYTNSNLTQRFSFDSPVYSSFTLYAKWVHESELCTVSFSCQGGSHVDPLTGIISGSTIAAPAEPSRSGYSFGGWFREAGCTRSWNFSSDVVSENITLYAQWIQDPAPPAPTPTQPDPPVDPTPVRPTPAPTPTPVPVTTEPVEEEEQPEPKEEVVAAERAAGSLYSTPSPLPETESSAQTEAIGGGAVPLFGQNGQYWALANLVLAILSFLGGMLALIRGIRRKTSQPNASGEESDAQLSEHYKAQEHKAGKHLWPIFGALLGVASPIVFFLTENMSLPMAIFDTWTLVMAALVLLQVVFAVLQGGSRRSHEYVSAR